MVFAKAATESAAAGNRYKTIKNYQALVRDDKIKLSFANGYSNILKVKQKMWLSQKERLTLKTSWEAFKLCTAH